MRDGTAWGDGQGAAPEPGGLDWDDGLFRDDARAYAPQGAGRAGSYAPRGPEIPGPRAPEAGSHRPGAGGPGTPDGADDGRPGPGGGHRRGGPRTPRSRKRKVLRWIAISTAVVVLGTAGAAYGYYEYLASKIRKGQRSSGTTDVAKPKANADGSRAMNILVLGSDSRASAADAELGGARDSVGERADVIMIVHLSADRSNMSVVSIPRDTRVRIPDCTDPKTKKFYPATTDIINASLGRGGAGCTLATVQNLTNVYIDHWLKIDFAGVVKMADVVGGVDVCVDQPVYDHPTKQVPGTSHLLLKKAGRQTVYGDTALAWLRARHPFFDDAGRAKAQHMYMSSLMRKLRGENIFTDPAKLNKIATTAMEAFEVSSEIGTPKKLYDLGMELKSVPSNRMTMLTMPHIADPQNNAHYLPDPANAATIWSLLRNDVPMDANGKAKTGTSSPKPSGSPAPSGPTAAAPSAIPVTVVNGTAGDGNGVATPHRASGITAFLKTAGFTQAVAGQTSKPSQITTLVYPAASGAQGKANATAVAKALKIPVSNVKSSPDAQSITLTIGADWKTGTDFGATLPKQGALPSNADVINGADSKSCMPVYWPYVYHGN